MAGKHICVSYARPDDEKWALQSAQSIMWDNGAFSARNSPKGFDHAEFAKWVEPRLAHPHWAVVPDVIGGLVEQQRSLIAQWPHPKNLSAPVWHMNLSIDWLLELADEWPRICFGSAAQYWQVGSDAWRGRADQAFNEMERRGFRPWVHMLRGMDLCGDVWPFASADSCNVAVNYKTRKICPERMARNIDARQSPIRWHMAPVQATLFEVEGNPQ